MTTPTIPEHTGYAEFVGDAGPLSPTAMFHLAVATLERGVELHSLTEDEIRVLVSATTTHIVDERDFHASRADRAEAALREAREALSFYADNHEWPNEGPWGVDSNDYGDVARAALGKMGDGKRAAALSDLAALDGETL